MYKYNNTAAKEALNSVKTAASTLETIPVDMATASNLASSVKVEGLDFLNNGSYKDTIEIVSNYPFIIIGMISEAERALIIECLQNGDTKKLAQYVSDGDISTQALIEYSKEYMLDIMNSGKANSYNIGFQVIGGANPAYSTVFDALIAEGFSKDFVYNLSDAYCKNLIHNDLYYTREGTVTMAVSFTGLLAMFGLKLGYCNTEFDKSYDGFFFGNGEVGSRTLGAIDCCNYTDWLARCSGIDIYAYDAGSKYIYANDGDTEMDEYLAYYNDPYYTNGIGGDYLSTKQHIMMIVANDGNGYFFVEDGSYGEINYMTYQELCNKGYRVTNTDALYSNTAKPHVDEYIWLDDDGNLASSMNGNKVKKTEVFANPYWIANQKNINLSDEELESLKKQWEKRNKNPNFTGVEYIPRTKEREYEGSTNDFWKSLKEPAHVKEPSQGNSGLANSNDEVIDIPNDIETEIPDNIGTEIPDNIESIDDILPNNKFSDVLPPLTGGKLGSMEISKGSVSYEVFDVNNSIYDEYVQSLLDEGYVMSSDGTFIKEYYQVIASITENGNMIIKLTLI